VLEIEEPQAHAAHFWVRDATSEGLRPVQRYLDSLDDIRHVQTAIVERARQDDVPVVENSSIERTIATVMELVLSSVQRVERV
jgi:2-phosphoglycerate kinase